MNESLRQVLRHHLIEQDQSIMIAVTQSLQRASGKPVSVHDTITRQNLTSLQFWLEALAALDNYPASKRAFDKYVEDLSFVIPKEGEDAAWDGEHKRMMLSTKGAGYSTRHMVKGLVHEIGHALEDNVKLDDIWGVEPFANNYCSVPGEDFAESFMLFNLDPEFLNHTTPIKYHEIERVSR